MCAKWQWNARDCVTGYCTAGVQSGNTSLSAFHCHFAHTRAFSLLSHTCYVQTEFRWVLSNDLNAKKVIHTYIFFKFAICSIALLSLGETCHLKGRNMVTVWRMVLLLSCYDCDSTHQHYDVTRFEYVLWRGTMHEWVMNIHYQTWIAQGRFINIIRTPSKQWGVCDKYIIEVWGYLSYEFWSLIILLHLPLLFFMHCNI